ncbi:hypothetical protein [Sinomicrobium weinanense]|uniref:Uncharacterized protein n=1 Tax=Sinomicrobium weinanense TaxID=2842200 RepID=A0A926JQ14_9FLAO|nr:hypothetical protein [Sinomicrobium weinanense]MBC9795365.1 hypothetical protein [Sinomicrobium weinanense]MBU3122920.1 hypothetical protein [Sinomicrobium weinanense]
MEWQHYFLGVFLILLLYYSALGLWYSFQKFKTLPNTFSNTKNETTESPVLPFEETSDEIFEQIEHLSNTLKQTIADAFQKRYNRSELLNSLASVLRRYPTLQHFPYQAAIHELIASECEKYGPVGLRKDELRDLWRREPDQA